MSTAKKKSAGAAVPQGRLGRLFNLGLAAGEIAMSGAVEGIRRFAAGESATQAVSGALLTAANAQKLAARLARLRGAAMKLGQLLSLEAEHLLPAEVSQALATLRMQAQPMPTAQLNRLLGREWGAGWRSRFLEFDETPVASASIGQVHRALTKDKRDLAIKVQYPGVANAIDSDVDNVAALLRLMNLLPVDIDVAGITAEAKRQLHAEADYLAEAKHLARFRKLLAADPQIIVPRVHTDFTTRRILAMDYVEGVPLETLGEEGVPQKVRDEMGTALQRLVFRELFEFHAMQTDPNFGNYLWERAANRLVLLDFGATREFPPAFVERFRRITRAVMANDRRTIELVAREIGYLWPEDSQERVEAVLDVIHLVCEPLRQRGRYDYGATDLPSRAREFGFELAFKKGLLRPPPTETIFLTRKLVGSFLVECGIKARVNTRALIHEALGDD